MKSYLFLFLSVCCFVLSCSKKEPAKTDYLISGISNVNARQDTSVVINLAVTQVTGPKEEVKLSVTGLPEKVGYKFSAVSGTPAFNSVLSLNIGYASPPGTHPIKIVGTSASGIVKEYPFNLVIEPVGDCRTKLAGTYAKSSACSGWVDGSDAVITIDTSRGDQIIIKNFVNTAIYKIDCEGKVIIVDHYAASYYKVTGKGFIVGDSIKFALTFTPQQNAPLPVLDCTVNMVRK